jgi:hypothetical protein
MGTLPPIGFQRRCDKHARLRQFTTISSPRVTGQSSNGSTRNTDGKSPARRTPALPRVAATHRGPSHPAGDRAVGDGTGLGVAAPACPRQLRGHGARVAKTGRTRGIRNVSTRYAGSRSPPAVLFHAVREPSPPGSNTSSFHHRDSDREHRPHPALTRSPPTFHPAVDIPETVRMPTRAANRPAVTRD